MYKVLSKPPFASRVGNPTSTRTAHEVLTMSLKGVHIVAGNPVFTNCINNLIFKLNGGETYNINIAKILVNFRVSQTL